MDPSFIQLYQRDHYLFYFTVKASDKTNNITLCKYNLLQNNQMKEIKTYHVKKGEKNAVSVLICKKDNYF